MSSFTERRMSNFIEVTKPSGDKVIVNTDKVEKIDSLQSYAQLYFASGDSLCTIVPYKDIRKVLGFEEKKHEDNE